MKRGRLANFILSNRLFVCTVILPILAAVCYFGIFAADVYVSESRFIVRTPNYQASTSPFSALLGTKTHFSLAGNDSYAVQNFILSRDALSLLHEKNNLRSFFESPKGDIFNRFPGIDWWNNSFEDFVLYYSNKVVKVELDSISSISKLSVRAFSADDAYHINQQLLELSEALVNQLNERGRQDMIRFAANEYSLAEKAAKDASLALANYRDQKAVINPEQQSSIQLQQVAKLQDELIATQAQLKQLQTFAANNPQIAPLQQRVNDLRHEISLVTQQVAGGAKSLANKTAEYERLVVERDYADKQLASAMASLEQARNEAQRKHLYLDRIVQPSKPDSAIEPRRLKGVFTVIFCSFVLFGILTILFAGIREHRS